MKEFILHWLDGTSETVKGDSIADAFRRHGYGGGAIAALDYYEETFNSKVLNLYHEGNLKTQEIATKLDVDVSEVLDVLEKDFLAGVEEADANNDD